MQRNFQKILDKLEAEKEIEIEKLRQIKNRQVSITQALMKEQAQKRKSDETRVKILLGSWLIKILKENSNNESLMKSYKQNIFGYCNSEKNEQSRNRNTQVITNFFDSLGL